jgi:hypothetical protein
MPSPYFTLSLADALETITVLDPGVETYTDTDGIKKERALAAVTVANVAVSPASGSSRLLPEGVRNSATFQAFVDLSVEATAKRAALVAGRAIQRANGGKLKITWVGDWGTHLVLALTGG